MILYVENPKYPTKNLLELNKWIQKNTRIQRSSAFLYTNNEQSEKEIIKNNFIYNSIRKNKILRNEPNQGCERLVQ